MRKELDRLVANVDPRAKIPRGFGLWSEALIVMWLRSHQRKSIPAGKPNGDEDMKPKLNDRQSWLLIYFLSKYPNGISENHGVSRSCTMNGREYGCPGGLG